MPERIITAMPEKSITAMPERIITAMPEKSITAMPEKSITAMPEKSITAMPEKSITAMPERIITAMPERSNSLKMSVYASLSASLMAAGAYIAIPVGPVPIVLQNMFVMTAGLLLGLRWGTAALMLYLFMGAWGLPVFAGGTGGIGRLFGPTGGYLLGYIPGVAAAALISGLPLFDRGGRFWKDAAAMTLGFLVVYAVGVPWLKMVLGLDWGGAVAAGMLPFLPGDAVKVFAGSYVAGRIRPMMGKTM
ncbi:MAG: biotin transporter BioY [Desulfamplus sp.]|nr:biotin transporter BioY [Desulfamplus sp.]